MGTHVSKMTLFRSFMIFAAVLAVTFGIALALTSAEPVYADGEYPLWVGGVQVTDDNKDDIFGGASAEAGSGTVSYDPSTNTLTLDGATVTGSHLYRNASTGEDYYASIYSQGMDLKINIAGDSKVGADPMPGRYWAIMGDSDDTTGEGGGLTITGDGKLVAESDDNAIKAYDDLNIKDTTIDASSKIESAIYSLENIYISGSNVKAVQNRRVTGEGYGIEAQNSLLVEDSYVEAETSSGTAIKAKRMTGDPTISLTGSIITTPEEPVLKNYSSSYYAVFESDGSTRAKKVIIERAFGITAETLGHGTVTASAEQAAEGSEITVTTTPDEGFELVSLTAEDADGNDVSITDNKFTMPGSSVTVTASFKKLITKAEIKIKEPVCGDGETPDVTIVTPDDERPDIVARWIQGSTVTGITGGETYTAYIILGVPGGKQETYEYADDAEIIVDGEKIEPSAIYPTAVFIRKEFTADHDWDDGVVTKKATEDMEGEMTYTCKACGAVKTESIDKLKPEPASTAKPVLAAKAIAKGKRKGVISWNNVKADRYVVYLADCNYNSDKGKYKKVKTLSGKKFKYTTKKLRKHKYYKFYVVAQKKVNGKYKTIATSYEGHFCTGNVRGSLTNPKSMKLNKTKVTLSKGGTASITAKVTKVKKGKKLATTHAKLLRYKSNNPTVATVNASGKVTAKSPGTATIYVQTINGMWKTCKVTVK